MNKLTSEQIEAVTKSLEKYKALRHSYFITDDELRHALEQVGEGDVKYMCDKCHWVGTLSNCDHEFGDGYDQKCCPTCNNVISDELHGRIYAENYTNPQTNK